MWQDQWVSNLALNWVTVVADTTSAGSVFQSFITLLLNEFALPSHSSGSWLGELPLMPSCSSVCGDSQQLFQVHGHAIMK